MLYAYSNIMASPYVIQQYMQYLKLHRTRLCRLIPHAYTQRTPEPRFLTWYNTHYVTVLLCLITVISTSCNTGKVQPYEKRVHSYAYVTMYERIRIMCV